jgi:hypothetical protein
MRLLRKEGVAMCITLFTKPRTRLTLQAAEHDLAMARAQHQEALNRPLSESDMSYYIFTHERLLNAEYHLRECLTARNNSVWS